MGHGNPGRICSRQGPGHRYPHRTRGKAERLYAVAGAPRKQSKGCHRPEKNSRDLGALETRSPLRPPTSSEAHIPSTTVMVSALRTTTSKSFHRHNGLLVVRLHATRGSVLFASSGVEEE